MKKPSTTGGFFTSPIDQKISRVYTDPTLKKTRKHPMTKPNSERALESVALNNMAKYSILVDSQFFLMETGIDKNTVDDLVKEFIVAESQDDQEAIMATLQKSIVDFESDEFTLFLTVEDLLDAKVDNARNCVIVSDGSNTIDIEFKRIEPVGL